MRRFVALLLLAMASPVLAQPHGPPGAAHRGPGRELAPQDQKAIHDYKLTTSNVDKLVGAGVKLRDMAEKDPSMKQESPMQPGRSIDDSVKRIEEHPKAVALLKGEGLSPKEFLVGTFTMMTAAMWSSMKRSYPQAQVPEYVNPENLKFVEDHPEVIQKWQTAWSHGEHRMQPQGAQEHEQE